MYSLALFTAIGLIVRVVKVVRSHGRRRLYSFHTLMHCLSGLVVGLFVSLALALCTPFHLVEVGAWKLHSVQTDGESTCLWLSNEGAFTTYRMLRVNESGSLSPVTIFATEDNTEIWEKEDTSDAELKKYLLCHDPSWFLTKFALTELHIPVYRYKLSVPKGSVRTEFMVQ